MRRKRFPRRWDEDPFDEWPFSSSFFDLEEEFQNMRRFVEEMIRRMQEGSSEGEFSGPFIYGFTMRVGPDGRPQIQEFGTRHPHMRGGEEGGVREPLTDVIELDDRIIVTCELPGVSKEDIEVDANETGMTIKVNTERRRYYKEVEFPAKVDPRKAKATFNNGVLEITFRRVGRGGGRKILIE